MDSRVKTNAHKFVFETYRKNTKKCKNCSKNIPYGKRKNKFCCRSCSATYNNTGHPSHNKRIELKCCKRCGVYTKNKEFCSDVCYRLNWYEEYIKRWKTGSESGNDGGLAGVTGISRMVKRYLLNKYGNKCSRCGWNEVNVHTGKIPLTVEHIDGNAENSCESNLTILCPNCHALTSTYGGANRGRGKRRYNRMKK